MVETTRKIREIYEDIQRKIFYMIPEKWEEVYLYASVIERFGNVETGELFFYYIPKGILRKNPINVYEIPSKFNLDEAEYVRLVEILYDKIKVLRNEFKKFENGKTWSNLTITIKDMKFLVDYDYEDLQNSEFDSYQRHIIWRSKYLNMGLEKVSKEEREILKSYLARPNDLVRTESYEEGIYIKNIKNMVDYETENYESTQNVEYVASKNDKKRKNQILMSDEE
ncbi:MAG: antitoxin YezG family protein [Clostridia bacterium]|nr:antitoxin YezG family protein [Clostridia bacterium]